MTTMLPVSIGDAGFSTGVEIDRIKLSDSKDVQIEGVGSLGAATGTLSLYLNAYQVFECESNATGNFTVNLKGTSGGLSLARSLRKGDSKTCTLFVKNGTSAKYCTTVKVDGTTFTKGTNLFWSGGSAPTSGTASGWDEYQFTVRKQADGTLIVRASVVGAS